MRSEALEERVSRLWAVGGLVIMSAVWLLAVL
jgi:hypothetical protein